MKSGLFAVPFIVVSILLGAVVTVDFWTWFIVPLGAGQIGLVHALGLRLFVGYVTMKIPDHTDLGDKIPAWTQAFGAILASLLCWGLGYLYAVLSGVV